MKLVVVIVNYNSATLLERCLTSLSDQTLAPDRIIIVDNNSTEGLPRGLLDQYLNAELIQLDNNVGYGAAINRAAETLHDDDLLFCLNPDAFPEANWIETLVNTADAHPDFGSFASLMLDAGSPTLIDGAGDVFHLSGIPWRRFHGRTLSSTALHTGPVFSACAGAALYRVSAFRAVNGFDPDYFMYLEDVDLGFRLQQAGQPCLFVPDARVLHVGSAITGYRSHFSVYHGHRNVVYHYVKNLPLPLLILLLPLHLAMTLAVIGVYTLRGSAGSILKAKLDGIRMIPRAWRNRHQTGAGSLAILSRLTLTGSG